MSQNRQDIDKENEKEKEKQKNRKDRNILKDIIISIIVFVITGILITFMYLVISGQTSVIEKIFAHVFKEEKSYSYTDYITDLNNDNVSIVDITSGSDRATVVLKSEEQKRIPILSDVSAGYGKEALEEATHWIKLPSIIAKNADFGTFVSGDSMEPKINDGDLLLVQNIPQLDSGMIGIFLLNDNVFCKRYHYNPITKETVLKSLNLNYKPIIVTDEDDFRIVGKVVGIYDYTV